MRGLWTILRLARTLGVTDPRVSHDSAYHADVARVLAIAVGCLALVSCRDEAPKPEASAPVEVFYPIRGTVKAIAADRRSVTLDHEEIPGLMGPMEMEFGVADPSVVQGLEAGTRVEGVLRVRGRGPLITRLSRTAQ
jgi:Cu/Ag efflux protein CusF